MIMKKTYLTLALSGLLLLTAFALPAQPTPQVDERTRDLVALGRRYFKGQKWLDAAVTFNLASQRPFNNLTTYSHYMAGVSYYRMGEPEKSLKEFEKLLKDHPDSKYIEESKYHKGLILLGSDHTNDREKGLDMMYRLMEQSEEPTLKTDAEKSVRDFLFNSCDAELLSLYQKFAPDAYRSWFFEAQCYRLDQKMEGYRVLEKIKAWEAEGNAMTDYLFQLKSKYASGRISNPKRLNVAIFLSFHLERMDTANSIPKRSAWALEMFEGMKIALDTIGGQLNKEINVRVFDTQGDTSLLNRQIDSLTAFNPDVIIGDVRSSLARPISKWAEAHKVLHLIPRNPYGKLVENKRYTFLTHPSFKTHGAQIALHMYHAQNKRRFIVFNDQTTVSNWFAKAFMSALDTLPGTTVVEKSIAQEYELNRKSIPQYVKSLRGSSYDAIYIPLSSEEAAGLIISQLNYHKVDIPVIGGPDWEIFNVIDPDLKTMYDLQYSAFYYDQNDSIMYDSLYTTCLREFSYQPSKYTVQGFDIMAYVLNLTNSEQGTGDLGEAVRQAPAYHGIHQDFEYGNGQINRKINIIKFQDGRTTKVNWDSQESGTFPDGE